MSQILNTKFLSYRNGYFQGQTNANLRHGYGMLLIDDGPLFVASFKTDLLHGKAFSFINTEEYAFLQFSRGELEGPCVFRTAHQLLLMHFSNGRPVDRQLYINYEDATLKIMAYKNGRYDNLQSFPIENNNQLFLAERELGVKSLPPHNILEFLQRQFCEKHANFELKAMPNGEMLFQYSEQSSMLCLGFSLARSGQQLNSFGLYLNDKLNGMGCKFDRNTKFQGIFENGFLNGLGLRLSNNRYTFGFFEKGNLVQAVHLQQRSGGSLEKLRELRKKDHIKSFHFYNSFILKKTIRFRDIVEVTIGSSPLKHNLYSSNSQITPQSHSSSLKGSNVSLNQILSGSRVQPTLFQTPNKPMVYGSSVAKRKNEEEREAQVARVNRSLFQGANFSE